MAMQVKGHGWISLWYLKEILWHRGGILTKITLLSTLHKQHVSALSLTEGEKEYYPEIYPVHNHTYVHTYIFTPPQLSIQNNYFTWKKNMHIKPFWKVSHLQSPTFLWKTHTHVSRSEFSQCMRTFRNIYAQVRKYLFVRVVIAV